MSFLANCSSREKFLNGEWRIIEVQNRDSLVQNFTQPNQESPVIEFRDDYNFRFYNLLGEQLGKWTMKGDTLYLFSSTDTASLFIEELTEKRFVWRLREGLRFSAEKRVADNKKQRNRRINRTKSPSDDEDYSILQSRN